MTPCVEAKWKSKNGYGLVRVNGKLRLAHRVAYEREIGPIPVGLDLDHLCRNRACINPKHMEPVTRQVNLLRGFDARGTHCPAGHEYTAGNTYHHASHGRRRCRTCTLERNRAYQKRPEVKARLNAQAREKRAASRKVAT